MKIGERKKGASFADLGRVPNSSASAGSVHVFSDSSSAHTFLRVSYRCDNDSFQVNLTPTFSIKYLNSMHSCQQYWNIESFTCRWLYSGSLVLPSISFCNNLNVDTTSEKEWSKGRGYVSKAHVLPIRQGHVGDSRNRRSVFALSVAQSYRYHLARIVWSQEAIIR